MITKRRLLANELSPEDIWRRLQNNFSKREMLIPAPCNLYFPTSLGLIYCRTSRAQIERHCCLMASVLGAWRSCWSLRYVSHSETPEIYLVFFSSESSDSSFETLTSAEGLCRHFLSSLWGWALIPTGQASRNHVLPLLNNA